MKTALIAVAASVLLASCSTAQPRPVEEPFRVVETPTSTADTASPHPHKKPKAKPTAHPNKTMRAKKSPAPVRRKETYYANCAAAREAGAAPLHRGDPGYSRKLDRDGDGSACE